jgi:hypothetical protein
MAGLESKYELSNKKLTREGGLPLTAGPVWDNYLQKTLGGSSNDDGAAVAGGIIEWEIDWANTGIWEDTQPSSILTEQSLKISRNVDGTQHLVFTGSFDTEKVDHQIVLKARIKKGKNSAGDEDYTGSIYFRFGESYY